MRKAIVAIVLALVMMLGGGAVLAVQAAPAGGGVWQRLGNRPLGRMLMGQLGRAMALRSELNITDEQRAQLRQILVSHKAEIAAATRPLVERARALREAVAAEQPDERAIRAAAAELGAAIGDAAVLASKVRGEAARVLTPQQLELIQQFHADRAQAVDELLGRIGEAQ